MSSKYSIAPQFSDEQALQIVNEVKATMAIEGFQFTKMEADILIEFARGEISREEAFKKFNVVT